MNVLIRVDKEFDDKAGEEKNTVNYNNVKRTKVKETNPTINSASGLSVETPQNPENIKPEDMNVDIDDSDLPF